MSKPPNSLDVTEPVAVLSDLHLGHPATRFDKVDALRPLLAGARTAIFNGDTFEQLNRSRRRHATKLLHDLYDLCDREEIRPIIVTGNHDPRASTAQYLDLFDGQVFATHGDVLHPGIAPWSKEGEAMLDYRKRLLRHHAEPESLDELMYLSKRVSLIGTVYDHHTVKRAGLWARSVFVGRFVKEPWRIPRTLLYWGNIARYSGRLHARFRPDAKLMLIGHTHRPGVWRHRDFTLVNTGSFQPMSRPLLVSIHDRRATIFSTKYRRGEYRTTRALHHVDLSGC